ncbi:MAG: branched-chain amino acid ABC transporter permease [SAR324 cluster bacterium]|nr:branched-chain amino acid ABC transporter permease [SAR324 cluster bacterium]
MKKLFTLDRFVALFLIALSLLLSESVEYYGQELIAEITILAIFAMSLDLLVGYAGLVSLGHAAFLGIGSYATGILTVQYGWEMFPTMLISIALAGLVSALVGIFVVRLEGIFFIMITLAVSQMFHAYFLKNREFGGDDGMPGIQRLDLEAFGLTVFDPADFAKFTLIVAVLVYIGLDLLMSSPFGRYLIGIHQNENRMRSLGVPVEQYKLAIFIIAGMVAGLSGSLQAQHTGFVSPDAMFWTVSGVVLIMVIAGGTGSLVGAVVGAVIVRLLSHQISSLTEHWMLFMGLFFIAIVLFASDGIYGTFAKYCRRSRWWKSAGNSSD